MTDDLDVVDAAAAGLDSAQDLTEEREVPCAFVCGIAGSGKTTLVRERVQSQDGYGILCASTGIAAVNLNATTVNSLLGYFDSASMRDAFLSGFISRKLHDLALEYEWLIWDEISMADGDQLDIAYRAMQEANRYRDITRPMGIMCVGDFCQLPPIKAKWAFEANCWDRFAANTTKLTEVHRQGDAKFLAALNLVRAGNGAASAESLTQAGVQWESQLDTEFDGTTILPKNDQVDRFNQIALDRLQAKQIVVQSRRWGKLRKEWAHVPERLELKVGAYVMILANSSSAVSIDTLHCKGCGAKFEHHATDLCILPKDILSPIHKKLGEENKESSPDVLNELPLEVDKARIQELEEGNKGEEPTSGIKEYRQDTQIDRRLCEGVPSRPPESYQERTHISTSSGDGSCLGKENEEKRDSSPPQWSKTRQSTRESSIGYVGDSSGGNSLSVLSGEIRNTLKCSRCGLVAEPVARNSETLNFANGDCGHVVEYTPASRTKTGEVIPDCFLVKLVRTGRTESIYRVVRDVAQKDRPEGWSGQAVSKLNDTGEYLAYPHYRGQKKRYVQGQLESFPLRVAYASTVHKSQGLSLDKVQIDFRNHFFGMPAMAYVSVSRARTIAGLRLVGQREVFAKRVQIDPKVREWL